MCGALYTKPTPTLEVLGSCNASGVHRMAKEVQRSPSEVTSIRWGPVGLVSHARRLAVETVFKDSNSTCNVKPRAPK